MSVLNSINDQRRKDVALQKIKVPIESLKRTVMYKQQCKSLKAALVNAGQVAVIAEHKTSSPSEGNYNCSCTLDEVVRGYEKAGAIALSILTEPNRFGGSLKHLQQARGLSLLPLLRKDFILDPYQVHEAKSAGADAILLIAASLNFQQARELSSLAYDLGLEILLELHDESELDFLSLNPHVVGINNRNLKTLKIDLSSSLKLFDQLPDDCIKISESGIKNAEDAARMLSHGYNGLLVGTQFMKTDSPGRACQSFISSTSALLKVKNILQ